MTAFLLQGLNMLL